jgi:hypothetical protein
MAYRLRTVILMLVLLIALMVAGAALSQTSGSFNLRWHVVGGGGGPATSSSYVVKGTAGQAAASPPYLLSRRYLVNAGYWSSESHARSHQVFVSLLKR